MRRLQNVQPRKQVLGITGAALTAITGGAGVKGSWVTLGTLDFACAGLNVFWAVSSTRWGRLDIGINTGGADVVVIEDLYAPFGASALPSSVQAYFPIRLPAGAVIKARYHLNAGGTLFAAAEAVSRAPGTVVFGTRMRSLTDWSGAEPANTVALNGTTPTAWTTICASTPVDVTRLWFQPTFAGDFTRTGGQSMLVELATGAAAAEHVISSFYMMSSVLYAVPHVVPCGRIPAGTRLSFRATSYNAATDPIGGNCLGMQA